MPAPVTQQQQASAFYGRALTLTADNILDDDGRVFTASVSSETPYERWAYDLGRKVTEVLGHDDGEVDLTRLNDGAPFFYNHSVWGDEKPLGAIQRAWIENKRIHAEIRLSKRAEVDGVWQDIKDGILTKISVGYTVAERKLVEETEDKPPVYRATSWTPHEVSLVPIPADDTVGIGRSAQYQQLREQTMPQSLKKPEENGGAGENEGKRSAQPPVAAPPGAAGDDSAVRAAADKAAKEAVEAERVRTREIQARFAAFPGNDELLKRCLEEDITVENASDMLVKALGEQAPKPSGGGARTEVGETDKVKFARAAEFTLCRRAGVPEGKTDEAPGDPAEYGLGAMSLRELARECLIRADVKPHGFAGVMDMVGRAFTHSSSDFPKILANTARKALLLGYDETEEVFPLISRKMPLSDFKETSLAGLGAFSDLDKIPENGEYKHGSFGERNETIKLAKYGKMFGISREAIINDDLGAFTRIPRKMGQAAKRKVGDIVFAVLTSNPTMSDGVALFHANHNNLAGAAAAPTAASFGAGRTAIGTQKDGTATLNISPALVVAPRALEDTIRVLLSSETDPSKANSRIPNPVRNMAEPVFDARLDNDSVTAWYLTANPGQFDTIGVGYLNGNEAPYMEEKEGFTVDGMTYKVRMEAAAAALEYRTMYKNAGA